PPQVKKTTTTLLRNPGAAALGYVTVAVVSFVLPVILWIGLGPDGAFLPGGWDTSGAWNAGWMFIAVAGAGAGGFVCSKVTADRRGVWILIGALVVGGALSAAFYDVASSALISTPRTSGPC
ncbi:MAG: hypothetical protein OXC11_01245, partial [Rhodospirillales bacterium]|nr:hypothetical protein [Rhodospirillales bacterium]